MTDLSIGVVAPVGRDAELICELLARVSVDAMQFSDIESLCKQAEEAVGAFLLADEVLNYSSVECLADFVRRQPSWSDVPVIILTASGQVTIHSEARRELREPLGNIVLVERPVRPETLVSTVNSALRARKRQYEVRAHLEQERIAADALRRSEKLAVVGRLAATIAHEINNPLEAITNLHFLIGSALTLDEAKHYLSIADQELARVIEITNQTLRFHRETNTPTKVNVTDVVDSVLKLYGRKLSTGQIKVERSSVPSATIIGYAGELRQVFVNLVSNAVDAMPNGGTLNIRISSSSEYRNGGRRGVRVVIADTGSGIPEQVRARILEPFVSTKSDTGTGLGLWVSAEIVRKHAGELRFRSREGRGTVFSVFLPQGMRRRAERAK